ncbi:MAG: IS5 family transposase ISBmu2 [Pseudomonadales bacterium]|nr:IS5 family transposase ISBmu2 [Pseudomonadales bacterium]
MSSSHTVPSRMKQVSFSDAEFAAKKKVTRRERFLSDLDRLVPWQALAAVIEPHYPKSGERGRPPIGLERMLRMYVAQNALGLSDEGIEDAIYDSGSVRRFVGVDLAAESAPDATTLLKFRRLLETHGLTQRLFDTINAGLESAGCLLRKGTIVDATLIAAAPSTKNRAKARDPEMHQSKKGQQWYFGLKAHIGVDAASGLVHTVVATAGNVADVTQAAELLHGEEEVAFADAGYVGAPRRAELDGKHVEWQIAAKRGTIKKLAQDSAYRVALEALEKAKASMRAKVEHPFHVVKNLFRHRKARYKGLGKNAAQLFTLFGLANLMLARRYLARAHGGGAP